uniref:ethanolamine-phosphate cytidylyltransferase n=1 Tax=Haptolina brevifila TaxID=156173 RepID=A0A7S2DEV6_9EUKA
MAPAEYLGLGSVLMGALGVAVVAIFNFVEASQASRRKLQEKVAEAEKRVAELEAEKRLSRPKSASREKKEVRIWMDGAFDMMHYGHVNAFRKGRALGTHLIVGVNDDESITRCKGPPVMNNEERLAAVRACKFVDEVVPDVPYIMDDEYVRWMIKEYNIDYVVHGDDPCIVDGRDVYESARILGRYLTIPRTEGISTTDIVGRMLLLTNQHHASSPRLTPLTKPSVTGTKILDAVPALELDEMEASTSAAKSIEVAVEAPPTPVASAQAFVRESKFLTTSRMLRLFAQGCTDPPEGAKVVYVDGGWDMFHAGHMQFLERARALGDFLIVGVHNDVVVNRYRGANFPIMNTNERTLSVLSCKHVGDVVIDPPWHMTREMLAALNISIVAHGSTNDVNDDAGADPYEVPKAMGIFRTLPSSSDLTVDVLVSRIQANHERMTAKIEKKRKSESEYYASRYGFDAKAETGTTH